MGDTLITIVAIFVAGILIFVFPMITVAERNDDVAQLATQAITDEFVDKIRSSGKIREEDYNAYLQKLAATGNSYNVEIKVSILDENPGKKASMADTEKIGENIYYNEYTSQILKKMDEIPGKIYYLKQGDIVSVSAKNTNITISQMFKNLFYSIGGNGNYQIAVQHAGVVTTTGK